MNKHSLSSLCGGVSIRNLRRPNIFRMRGGGLHQCAAMSWMKRRWLGGSEVAPDIQVTLHVLHLLILSILFIIDKAPLTHSPNAVLVLVRVFLSSALHPLSVRSHTS